MTVCACVKQTICDGLAEGFRLIGVMEAMGDIVPGAVAWKLFDIDAKFGDVLSLEYTLNEITNITS